MSAGEHDIGSPEWYAVQFGPQKSYREVLFGPWPDERPEHERPWRLT